LDKLNLKSKFRPKDAKYIDKVGIELEGGWLDRPARIKDDISVQITDPPPTCNHECHCPECFPKGSLCGKKQYNTGEVASNPISPRYAPRWVRKAYPDTHNQTCGLHIHTSFKSIKDYKKLMDKKFYEFFLKRFKKWGEERKLPSNHPFWPRLRGENRFCYEGFIPEEQVQIKVKNDGNRRSNVTGKEIRRTHLNYCYELHRTLECRMLPMFETPELANEAIEEYIQCIEDYLDQAPNIPDPPAETITVKEVEQETDSGKKVSELDLVDLFKAKDVGGVRKYF
jgi:hypothetical protein